MGDKGGNVHRVRCEEGGLDGSSPSVGDDLKLSWLEHAWRVAIESSWVVHTTLRPACCKRLSGRLHMTRST